MKLILTLIFLLVGCSSSNIEIESRISNQELERRLSESSNDRELLMSSFRLLIKSPSFNFDWARMWKDLSQRKPFFDSTDSTAWQLVFRAAKRSCLDGNPDARNQYLLYLFHLRSFSEFKQDLNPVLQYRVCEVQPSENVAEKIWTLELNQSDPDLETLSYALNGLQTSWLNQQPASTWDRLADLIILQLDGVGQIPSPSVELLAKLLTNRLLDQTSLSRLAFTALLSDETANAVGAFDSHNLNVIFALSGLQHASSSDQFHSWSMRALHIIVNAFLGGQINLKQSIQYNHEIFSHLSGHFGRLQFSKENGLKKWISGFDKVNDLYFIKLSQDPALKMEFLESFFRNISPKPQEVWLATMLEGTLPLSFHQQVLDSFIYSGNPLEQWLASRIILRNRLQKDINDLFPNRQDHHGLAFWGNDKQCPIPRISN